jgi:hypothetical protein
MNWCTPTGVVTGLALHNIAHCCVTAPGVHVVEALVSTGAAKSMIAALQAHELRGASRIHEANVEGVAVVLYTLQAIDLTRSEADTLFALLRTVPSALRFCLEHDLQNIKAIGSTSAALATTTAAVVFGKDEDGFFQFTQELVDTTIECLKHQLSGAAATFFPHLQAHWLRPILHLTVSDTHKALLIRSPGLIAFLLETLLLPNPEHTRNAAKDSEKAPIQADAADALLQLAVYEPARELLLKDSALLEALRAMVGGAALTEAAALSAQNALMAIEGVENTRRHAATGSESQLHAVDGQKHIMLSCEYLNLRRCL